MHHLGFYGLTDNVNNADYDRHTLGVLLENRWRAERTPPCRGKLGLRFTGG